MPPPFSNFYARDISKYYEWKRRILKRERLEWLQEVKERNARSEEGKRREAQEKLRKENSKIFKTLHNEGRLKLTIFRVEPLTMIKKGKFYKSRALWVEAKVDITQEKTEFSTLLLLRKVKAFYKQV
jgi:hypothetical protein